MQLDRSVIAKLKSLAQEAKARGTPHLKVMIACDGANQCNFVTPAFASRAHGIDDRWVAAVITFVQVVSRIDADGRTLLWYTVFVELLADLGLLFACVALAHSEGEG